ncbi:MAG: ferritin [Spirochaetia bacterium]|nr:ferritin [Spirochaetia bacterium]
MISKKVADRINLQIEREMDSAFLYLDMASRMVDEGYEGFANWLTVQYHEEMFHAMKFARYLQDRDASFAVPAIPRQELKESSVKALFERVLAHEQKVTASINELYELALAEKDYPTQVLCQWYINEQVEEEKNAEEILRNLALLGDSKQGIFMLNIELGKRKASIPLDFTEIGGED